MLLLLLRQLPVLSCRKACHRPVPSHAVVPSSDGAASDGTATSVRPIPQVGDVVVPNKFQWVEDILLERIQHGAIARFDTQKGSAMGETPHH